jgi:ribonuclease Z
MKKLWVAGFVLLIGVLLGRGFIVPAIAERSFTRLLSANLGLDPSAELPDGLHIYVCGAGSPLPDPQRSGSCLGVLAGDKAFIFDAGSGGALNLGPMGFPLVRTEEVFLTHLHSDHFDGLGQMLLGTWINSKRTAPTPVSGPTGTAEIVAGFNTAYRIDSTFRTAHHGADIADPAVYGATAREITLDGDQQVVYDQGGVKITAFKVTHDPVTPAFGYRIDYKDRAVSISGDTAYDPRVAAASKDVDVLFHEALNMAMVETMEQIANRNGAPGIAQILFDIRDYHTSPVDAARIATQAGATDLVLYHIVPMLPSDALIPVFIKDAKSEFDGRMTVSKDGTIVRLPTGTDAIIYEDGL